MSDDWLKRICQLASDEVATWDVSLQLATPSARAEWLDEVERIGDAHSAGEMFLKAAADAVSFNPACVRALVEAREAHVEKYRERRRVAIAKLNDELGGHKTGTPPA